MSKKHLKGTADRTGASVSRRRFLGLAGVSGLAAASMAALSGCGESSTTSPTASTTSGDWNSIVAAAKGQTVSWYGYGGEKPRNEWIDSVVAPALKQKYDITLKRVPMNIDDILTKLSGEMTAGKTDGSIDFIWINGENFYSTKKNGYLYGPFASKLPNYDSYINTSATDMNYDFGEPIEGYEAPYGKAQMVCWCDTKVVPQANFPTDTASFLEFCKAHKGKVTYPKPGDFTGTAFISCLMAGAIGKANWEQLASLDGKKDADKVKQIIEPGMEYLRSLNPYLWKQGKTFPADSGTVDGMFADGELVLDMGYRFPQSSMDDGTFPKTTRPFELTSGMVGNVNFMAIAANASHKEAAMVAINEVMSPEMQLSQYQELQTMTVLDTSKLDSAMQQKFKSVKIGNGCLPLDTMQQYRVAEANGSCIDVIEEVWTNEVVGK